MVSETYLSMQCRILDRKVFGGPGATMFTVAEGESNQDRN